MANFEIFALLLVLIVVIFVLAVGGGLFATMLLMSRDTVRIPEILSRLTRTEDVITTLAKDLDADLNYSGNMKEIWKSSDGKYVANSFEELLSMMANDPDGPLSPDEIATIKSIFEKIIDDDKNDDDSIDNEKEPWKK